MMAISPDTRPDYAMSRDRGASPAFQIESLTAGYRSQPVLFNVSLSANAGRITAVIGPNGAGKSTLFKAAFGIARVFSGRLLLNGERIEPSPKVLVPRGIAYVPQVRNVFPSLSVRENLEIGASAGRKSSLARVFSLFPDLEAVPHKAARNLSGGQRNMLAVGRALMSNPDVILLDEATGGLSPLLARRLWEHLAELANSGVTIVVIEQDVRMTLNFAHYVYLLAAGKNLLSGTPHELSAQPDFDQLFLEGSDEPGGSES